MARHLLLLCAFVILSGAAQANLKGCMGNATYEVIFQNFLTPENFDNMIPENGLVFAPIAGATHSGRVSILTVRGFAIPEVEEIAETGDNSGLVALGTTLQESGLIKDLAAADGPTMPGNFTKLQFMVDCERSFITVLGMIAPSPDWIVQVSNLNLYSSTFGEFIKYKWGYLIAYDAGTDSGGDFTDPADPSLDIPTEPPQNIAPLVEDETDAFNGRPVGKYIIRKIA